MFIKLYAAAQAALASKKGATMVEYALLIALVALVATVGLTTLGSGLSSKFTAINGQL